MIGAAAGAPDRRSRRHHHRRATALVLLAIVLGATGCAGAATGTSADPPSVRTGPSATDVAPVAAAPLVLASSRPTRVLIPQIGVDSELMDLGLQADGTLEVPAEGFPAGWFTGAPTPGELGPAILAGHVDWAGLPGVFSRLHELVPGNEIQVLRADGSTAVFVVSRVERFAKDAFPTDTVYGDLDHAGLRVITCGGDFDRQAGSYVDDVVVFADLSTATG